VFSTLFFLLPSLVVPVVVEYAGRVLKVMDNKETLTALLGRQDLLRVPGIGDGFVLVCFQPNMTELLIRHILDVDPFKAKPTFPFILCPYPGIRVVVDRRDHPSNSAKMTRPVHREQEENWAPLIAFPIGIVKTLISVIRRTPDLVLDGAVNVVF
jgi:hypothetical protein